jgi:hypothetical protein
MKPVVDQHHDRREHDAEAGCPPHCEYAYQRPQEPRVVLAQREHRVQEHQGDGQVGACT